MRAEDIVINETAQVPIAIGGHRIVSGTGDQTGGVVKLKLVGELINGECDVHLTMASPVLYAGAVLGKNLDYLPPFFSLSPSASWAANDMDAAAERLERISCGAYEVGAPDPEGQILGYWQRSPEFVALMKAMLLGGSEVACAILLEDLSPEQLRDGVSANVMTAGEINESALNFHPSVARDSAARAIKFNQLKEAGIHVITQGNSSAAAGLMQVRNK